MVISFMTKSIMPNKSELIQYNTALAITSKIQETSKDTLRKLP